MYDMVHRMGKAELAALIARNQNAPDPALLWEAALLRDRHYGRRVILRGLVEFSSHCRMDCYYCGLRKSNRRIRRYRLDADQILNCVRDGYRRGLRSFVLQGGEDAYYQGERMVLLVARIKGEMPDAAITLSLGELPADLFRALKEAGADRYLLRHETADDAHFARLHPPGQTLSSRKRCLYRLRELGYQVGAGFMVGSPGQTHEILAEDLLFLRELQPHMVGIGPFLPQSQTPFARETPGSLSLTLTMLALTRVLLPSVLLPATTALGTLAQDGRGLGLAAGANVLMPNLTPTGQRGGYLLYDGKIGIDDGTEEGLQQMLQSIRAAGYEPDLSRGDHQDFRQEINPVLSIGSIVPHNHSPEEAIPCP